ncbi:sporulation integral membrane protein YtvI [Paenibacillus sediminis]|uniref:Sporulation integral membrane protein YtvI n=1 Tax=Paenibacillus sediminis TaxID=664909 RepID=A0ABS4GY38_9BACL|nr:sporulation integral membrane protein YtvI [Paenibacillus sediminis]MBP1935193.1 sporulation integral membrane protein YtvI [Paenibacillus sediminis]
MLPFYRKYWRTAFDIGLIVLTVYLTMYIFSKLYQIAAPVFLSFIVFLLIEPLAKFLHKKGLPKVVASGISVILFVLLLLGLMFGAGLIIISQIAQINNNLPKYTQLVQEEFTRLVTLLQGKINALPDNITVKINEYFTNLTNVLSDLAGIAFSHIVTFLSSFSTFIANFGVAIILAFFLSVEIQRWRRLAKEKTPNTFKKAYTFLKEHVFHAIWGYVKAQALLVSISFLLIFVGLTIFRVDNAFTIALISAGFDVLPLVGVPVIFIPWIIYQFLVGHVGLAVSLTVLLVVVLLVRQLLEPKITGNSIGISSAYLMLSFAMISLSIFGMAGLILSPILLILIKELLKQGYLQRWIRLPKEEFDTSDLTSKAEDEPR